MIWKDSKTFCTTWVAKDAIRKGDLTGWMQGGELGVWRIEWTPCELRQNPEGLTCQRKKNDCSAFFKVLNEFGTESAPGRSEAEGRDTEDMMKQLLSSGASRSALQPCSSFQLVILKVQHTPRSSPTFPLLLHLSTCLLKSLFSTLTPESNRQ